MGKPGGFMDFRRKEPGYRPVAKRIKDYEPVELRLQDAEVRAQAARCMDCGTPFCHGCGCPLNNVIPELNDFVYQGRWKEALDLLLETNNFPEFTGRICPALCEASCVLNINDEPVTIRQIELAIIEKAFEKGYIRPRIPRIRNNRKVVVVGSGPSGLAVADILNRAGCKVTVYDKARHAGGILMYGIPDFKLEKSVVDRRIKLMRDEGVVFELGVTVGDDVSYNFLKDRFDVICLSGGARKPRDLVVPGRDLKGTYFAMQFLRQQNMRLMGEPIEKEEEIAAEGKTVLVLGGGDTGSDCLGTAIRQGAEKVYQFEIMPRPPDSRPETTPWPEWPNIMRESSSHKEGGERRWSVATKEIIGANGCVKAVQCIEVEWSDSGDGRRIMKDKPGSEFEIKVDLILLSMGFVGPAPNKLLKDLSVALDERGNIRVDERHMTNVEGIFAAGDMARGQSLIVRAIADGRKAAEGILSYLGQ